MEILTYKEYFSAYLVLNYKKVYKIVHNNTICDYFQNCFAKKFSLCLKSKSLRLNLSFMTRIKHFITFLVIHLLFMLWFYC